ncbi:hypothetical protein LTS08_000377 [Lithohypha guttulata]|uniref:uncharacterized protein n=1 Tax=Lithohypha guttulata TaxID=1690604 RepID=UPI002DDE147E|nr:hypothetical protein LTR51_006741 [Lithohypha guttulata]KAK5106259.1 hypothetical protein LTS08_000377 [Lithohypha guttulata]
MTQTNPPKALLFDVFGTCVDWRSTVTTFLSKTAEDTLSSSSSSLPSLVRTTAPTIDWGEFAWQWRKSYYEFTRSYDPTTGPFKSVDQHHLLSLIELLREYQLEGLWDEEELQRISMIWHFLDPWSDSAKGLQMLNQKFETATLSNGNTTLLTDLRTHGSLPFKHILSAENFGAYKPHADVYNGAAQQLGVQTNECAMVAAHLGDLHAAKHKCGYQTIYVERPQEETWDKEKVDDARRGGWVDIWVNENEGGFEEVARRLGCTMPEEGLYHETGGITGQLQGHTDSHDKDLEQQAREGIYHEDASIVR